MSLVTHEIPRQARDDNRLLSTVHIQCCSMPYGYICGGQWSLQGRSSKDLVPSSSLVPRRPSAETADLLPASVGPARFAREPVTARPLLGAIRHPTPHNRIDPSRSRAATGTGRAPRGHQPIPHGETRIPHSFITPTTGGPVCDTGWLRGCGGSGSCRPLRGRRWCATP